MKQDENIYRKKSNGRYEAFGVCYQPDYLPDGIWFVKHHEYSRSETSVPYIAGLFKVGDAREIDIPTLCGLDEMCTYITDSDEWKQMLNDNKGHSLNEIVHLCVKKIYDKNYSICDICTSENDIKTI